MTQKFEFLGALLREAPVVYRTMIPLSCFASLLFFLR